MYIKNLLKQHKMKNCHAVSISMQENLQITNTIINNNKFVNKYQSVVKKFQFLIIYIWLDISFAAEFLTCWNHALTKQCWETVKYIIRYLKNILNYDVLFDEFQKFHLVEYSNSNWKTNLQNRKSIIRFFIKIVDESVFWHSTK